jgi:ABC-2 type transport system permease protein
MPILKHECKMNQKNLVIWGISIGLFSFLCIILYPSLKDSLVDMSEAFANMGSLSQALGMDKIGLDTAMGYYATQIGPLFSLGGAMFAAVIGTGMLSKEEGGHTSEFLFSLPLGRRKVLIQKLVGMLVILVAFNLICVMLNISGFLIIGEEIERKDFALYHIAQLFMHIQIGGICFMISSFMKKNSIGIGIGITMLFYACDMMVKILPSFKNMKYIIPFSYSDAASIMVSHEVDLQLLGIGIGIMICSVVIGFVNYMRKDLA